MAQQLPTQAVQSNGRVDGPAWRDHALIGEAHKIPITPGTAVMTFSPVVLTGLGRLVNLQIKVSAPSVGDRLPVILLSHGQGQSNNLSSLNGYGPLVNFWAAHGFVVIQPTHLSSKTLSLPKETPGAPLFWRTRAQDMRDILDHLKQIEAAVPWLQGRLDRDRIAVAGHSMGGHTASMLLGMTLIDPEDGSTVNMADERIKAGLLLAAPGNGGADLSAFAAENFPVFRNPSFTKMSTQALVVIGEHDVSPHLSTRDASWHADPYTYSPGPKFLLSITGAKHLLGGISGYDAAEADDESPQRLAVVQRLTWAYLRSALYPEDPAWTIACATVEDLGHLAKVESK